jgi:hypothetical protein
MPDIASPRTFGVGAKPIILLQDEIPETQNPETSSSQRKNGINGNSGQFSKRTIWDSLKEKASEFGSSIRRKFSNFFASVAERFTKRKTQSEIVQNYLESLTYSSDGRVLTANPVTIEDEISMQIKNDEIKKRTKNPFTVNAPSNPLPPLAQEKSYSESIIDKNNDSTMYKIQNRDILYTSEQISKLNNQLILKINDRIDHYMNHCRSVRHKSDKVERLYTYLSSEYDGKFANEVFNKCNISIPKNDKGAQKLENGTNYTSKELGKIDQYLCLIGIRDKMTAQFCAELNV